MLFAVAVLLAETEGQKASGSLLDFLPLLAIFLLFYFIVLLPMRRDSRSRAQMIGNLKRNDKVEVNGFLIGTVAQILKADAATGGFDELIIKVEDGAKLRVLKTSVTRLIKSTNEAKDGGE